MKSITLFAAIGAAHVVIIGLLLVQPGCQTQPESTQPAQTELSRPQVAPAYQPAQSGQGSLDSAFNAGIGTGSNDNFSPTTSASSSRGVLLEPTRPPADARRAPDMSGLEPVLQPIRESIPSTASGRDVTVRAGDTATAIARREGVALDDFLRVNGLNRNSPIYVGQTLKLPASSASTSTESGTQSSGAASDSGQTVTVARGDTLSGLASRHGTTVAALKQVNGLSRDTIVVGQTLRLPAGSDNAGSVRSSTPTSSTRSTSPSATPSSGRSYTVKAGDTPGAIARQFGISSQQLMQANGITDPRRLVVGQQLAIPGSGSGTSSASSSTPTPRTAAAQTTTSPTPRETVRATQTPSRPSSSNTTAPSRTQELDPMSALEALEEEDLPFVEIENVQPSE